MTDDAAVQMLQARLERVEQLLMQTLGRLETPLLHTPNRLLSVQDACALLSISRTTLYQLIKAREIGVVERSGTHIPLTAVLDYIDRHTTPPVVSYGAARRRQEHEPRPTPVAARNDPRRQR